MYFNKIQKVFMNFVCLSVHSGSNSRKYGPIAMELQDDIRYI